MAIITDGDEANDDDDDDDDDDGDNYVNDYGDDDNDYDDGDDYVNDYGDDDNDNNNMTSGSLQGGHSDRHLVRISLNCVYQRLLSLFPPPQCIIIVIIILESECHHDHHHHDHSIGQDHYNHHPTLFIDSIRRAVTPTPVNLSVAPEIDFTPLLTPENEMLMMTVRDATL